MKTYITGLKHDAQVEQKARDKVLDELWKFCLDNGVELREDLIGYHGEDGFLLLKILKKIVELRRKEQMMRTKEREQG